MDSQDPRIRNVALAMKILFGKDVKTKTDAALLRICSTSGITLFLLPILLKAFHIPSRFYGKFLVVQGILLIIFVTSFSILGLHVVGRDAGKEGYVRQIGYGLSRVFLYLLLPCLLISIILTVYILVTD